MTDPVIDDSDARPGAHGGSGSAPAASIQLVQLAGPDDFEGWRSAARRLAAAGVSPGQVHWQAGVDDDLLAALPAVPAGPSDGAGATGFVVPRRFVELAGHAILHRDPERFALLYTLLSRLRDRPRSIDDAADPLIGRIEAMAKAVRRDIHKMRAFVRFRELQEPGADGGGATRFVAWFEPDHHIVRSNARFFVDRFAAMHWSILTPELSIHWDGAVLTESPGAQQADAPGGDPVEQVWKSYYAAIFNPARLKVGAMLKEMPRRYWKNMPETALVPGLIAGAQAREAAMIAAAAAERPEPPTPTGALSAPPIGALSTQPIGASYDAWRALRDEALACTRCPLYAPATQTVFGEGPPGARLMFVGEQPGDQEDLAGRPFIGPAGQVFDRALAQAGIDRGTVYVTNAVKHFKFEPRGRRRIHAKPDAGEIEACRWWVDQERLLVKPRLTVALGATAARALLGRTVTISRERGRVIDTQAGAVWITVHPSYLLRIEDKTAAAAEHERFVADLTAAGALVA